MKRGIARGDDSVIEVTSAWMKDQSVVVSKGDVIEYRVLIKVTFMVKNKAPDRKK